MAPAAVKKAVKRVATSPVKRQPAKVPKVHADPCMAAVIEAIELADVQPASCKQMLLATLPLTLGVPSDRRSAHMAQAVDMVRETIENTQRQLQSALDGDEANLNVLLNSKDQLVSNVTAAQGLVAVVAEEVATKHIASQEAESATQAAMLARKSMVDALKAAVDEATRNEAAIQEIQTATNLHLGALKCDNEDRASTAAIDHRDALLRAVKTMPDSSESFLLSVKATVEKTPAERGPFDGLVIEQLDKSLADRSAQLASLQGAQAVKKGELTAAADAAGFDVDRTQDAEVAAGNVFCAATGKHNEATEALRVAKAAETGFEPALARAKALRDEKMSKVQRFKEHNIACFTTLAEKVSVDPACMEVEGSTAAADETTKKGGA